MSKYSIDRRFRAVVNKPEVRIVRTVDDEVLGLLELDANHSGDTCIEFFIKDEHPVLSGSFIPGVMSLVTLGGDLIHHSHCFDELEVTESMIFRNQEFFVCRSWTFLRGYFLSLFHIPSWLSTPDYRRSSFPDPFGGIELSKSEYRAAVMQGDRIFYQGKYVPVEQVYLKTKE